MIPTIALFAHYKVNHFIIILNSQQQHAGIMKSLYIRSQYFHFFFYFYRVYIAHLFGKSNLAMALYFSTDLFKKAGLLDFLHQVKKYPPYQKVKVASKHNLIIFIFTIIICNITGFLKEARRGGNNPNRKFQTIQNNAKKLKSSYKKTIAFFKVWAYFPADIPSSIIINKENTKLDVLKYCLILYLPYPCIDVDVILLSSGLCPAIGSLKNSLSLKVFKGF